MSKPRKSKKEFSKIIIITVLIFTIGITIFSCIMIWRTGDLSPLTYLIPSIFAEAPVQLFIIARQKPKIFERLKRHKIFQKEK